MKTEERTITMRYSEDGDGSWDGHISLKINGMWFEITISDSYASSAIMNIPKHGFIDAMVTTDNEVIINTEEEKIYGVIPVARLKDMLLAHRTIQGLKGLLK